jgi:hypothetical protein
MAEGRTCVKKALVDAARKTAVAVAKNFTFPDVACM